MPWVLLVCGGLLKLLSSQDLLLPNCCRRAVRRAALPLESLWRELVYDMYVHIIMNILS